MDPGMGGGTHHSNAMLHQEPKKTDRWVEFEYVKDLFTVLSVIMVLRLCLFFLSALKLKESNTQENSTTYLLV